MGCIGGIIGMIIGMEVSDYVNNNNINSNYLKPENAKVVPLKKTDNGYKETNLIIDLNGDIDTIPLTNENAEKIIKAVQ